MLCVMCHMSHARCQVSHVRFFKKQNGWDSRWKVWYQRERVCLVFYIETLSKEYILHSSFFLLCNRHGELQCVTKYLTCDTQGVVNNMWWTMFYMWQCDIFFDLDCYHYVIQKIFFTQIHILICTLASGSFVTWNFSHLNCAAEYGHHAFWLCSFLWILTVAPTLSIITEVWRSNTVWYYSLRYVISDVLSVYLLPKRYFLFDPLIKQITVTQLLAFSALVVSCSCLSFFTFPFDLLFY